MRWSYSQFGFIWEEDKWCKDQRYKNKGTALAPLIIIFLMMFFHRTSSLISVLHNAHILHLPRFLTILLQQTLRIQCSNHWLKCALFLSSKANFNISLRPFKFSPFRSNNTSLTSSNANLINNNASLLNNISFLMVSNNFSLFLGFHYRPLHHIHHLHSVLFFFILISVLCFILHYIFICVVALIVDWGWLLFIIWMFYI